eukprot:1146757_1
MSTPLDNATKVRFQPEEIAPLIDILLNTSDLESVPNNENTSNIYKMLRHRFIYCWITPHSIIGNKTEFKFKFNLYIDDYHYDDYHQSVYKYTFKASFRQIRSLYTNAMEQRKYFPVQKFPKLLPETLARRSEKLKHDLLILDQYSFLENELRSLHGAYVCTGPGKEHWWSNKLIEANENDINTLSYILCKLFNSPAFCYMDEIFDCFLSESRFANGIRRIIKSKGFMLLNKLRMKSLKFTVKDPCNLHEQLFLDDKKKQMQFHSITVCARPVHGVKNVSLIDHWAIKFEGDEYLLTLDYYANSKVIAIICKNNCVGQKIFWYSWCANSRQFFTSRWGTLSKIYLHKEMQGISGECIGRIISSWRARHNKYCSMTNNCQHFVRDILTVFEFNAAQYLSTKFHHRVVEGIIFPSLPFMDEIDEQKRMKEIRGILQGTFEEYHQELPQLQLMNDDDEKRVVMNHSDTMVASLEIDVNAVIPDINEEGIENEESRFRFKQWLCDELGMEQYLHLFEKQELDQTQWIQWFDAEFMMKNVCIPCKLHALFIAEQTICFDVDVIQNVTVYQETFAQWLREEVKLDQYLTVFQQHQMDDMRQLQFFDAPALKGIGTQVTTHIQLILDKANSM